MNTPKENYKILAYHNRDNLEFIAASLSFKNATVKEFNSVIGYKSPKVLPSLEELQRGKSNV